MEKLNKKISDLRALMKAMKAEKYAIVNPDLMALDEYTKNLYLKVLCTVVQYENDPSEMQVLYLKRIIKGIKVEEPLEEYMRKALEISEVDLKEFVSFMKENLARYYFALESMLLVAMGNSKQQNFEYLAEILEVSGITKQDLEYVSLVAKSVLQQKSSFYDEAKLIIPEYGNQVSFKPYIGNYYAGAIVDTEYAKHYSAPSKELSNDIELPDTYSAKKASFSNLIISINSEWTFVSCEDVLFENCEIQGGTESIVFEACKNVVFSNCKISGFSAYTIVAKKVGCITLNKCEFKDCMYGESRSRQDWENLGAVIHWDEQILAAGENLFNGISNSEFQTIIDKCVFTDCGGRNYRYCYSSAVISNVRCKITNSKFVNCWHYNQNTRYDPEDRRRTLFTSDSVSENNETIGSANII